MSIANWLRTESRSSRFWSAIVVLGFIAAGCGSSQHRAAAEYHTVATDLRRDSELARRENAKAVLAVEQKQWDDAERSLKAALEADITYGPAHNNLGTVYFHQGKLYLAAWEFQYAIKAMPYQPEPRNNLGLVMEATGKLDEAVRCYDEAGEMQTENPDFAGNAVRARLRRGDRDKIVGELLQKVASYSEDPQWSAWARQRLATFRSSSPSTPPMP